jgi:hypothetical protein
MTNALHFQPPQVQEAVVRQIRAYLRPGSRLILVEYDSDEGNPWMPYPFPSLPGRLCLRIAALAVCPRGEVRIVQHRQPCLLE